MNHESFILHGKIYIILEKNSYCDFCKFVNITSCVGLFKGVEFFDNFHHLSVCLYPGLYLKDKSVLIMIKIYLKPCFKYILSVILKIFFKIYFQTYFDR